MNAVTITPLLSMGSVEAAAVWPDMIPVESASDAYTAMMSRHTALLPVGRWDLAAETLRLCGADEDWVQFTLNRAGR